MTLTPNDSETRLYIDVKLVNRDGGRIKVTFGPFSDRSLAEQALVEVMRRADVRGAIIRDPQCLTLTHP